VQLLAGSVALTPAGVAYTQCAPVPRRPINSATVNLVPTRHLVLAKQAGVTHRQAERNHSLPARSNTSKSLSHSTVALINQFHSRLQPLLSVKRVWLRLFEEANNERNNSAVLYSSCTYSPT